MFLQIASVVLAIAAFLDGLSTVSMLRNGSTEQNPLFGSRPSALRVFGEGAAIIGLEIFSGFILAHRFHPMRDAVFACMMTQAMIHVDRTIHNFRLK